MSNFRLFQEGGTSKDISVMSVHGWASTSRSMRLTQAPGGSQSFVLGRSTKRVLPLRFRIVVEEDTEALARTTLGAISQFARDAVSVERMEDVGVEARVTTGGVTRVTTSGAARETTGFASRERRGLLGAGGSLARVSPEPLHLGADAWSVLVELRPSGVEVL